MEFFFLRFAYTLFVLGFFAWQDYHTGEISAEPAAVYLLSGVFLVVLNPDSAYFFFLTAILSTILVSLNWLGVGDAFFLTGLSAWLPGSFAIDVFKVASVFLTAFVIGKYVLPVVLKRGDVISGLRKVLLVPERFFPFILLAFLVESILAFTF